ncbi:DUF6036 family nucleotidyltransferase [Gloeobacter violaceus]|uniref:Gll2951 protein n=1 Tax=Gloeobacter violaceus (strain ATCC 29082 / PCC 7421) TaxID=251221 RepID=Q7NCM7_GLOVI|nr:DUF6036 family nucleotidyltransferase [Gloeobacter violaceus]BAC90892.1 gll2951 [Gloeobacter violaceus PCC 7421]
MSVTHEILERALATLGEVLAERGVFCEVVVIGGGGLVLLNLLERATRDIDVVALVEGNRYQSAQPLPRVLREAAAEVALLLGLADDWLNGAPTDLLRAGLPEGFRERAVVRTYKALTVQIASRYDQVHFKLYAAVDQGPKSKHYADLKRLKPSAAELIAAARWCLTHADGIEQDLQAALNSLGVADVEL